MISPCLSVAEALAINSSQSWKQHSLTIHLGKEAVRRITESEDVLFYWCIISTSWDNDCSTALLNMIAKMWLWHLCTSFQMHILKRLVPWCGHSALLEHCHGLNMYIQNGQIALDRARDRGVIWTKYQHKRQGVS
ncbi:hypothetical protein EMCRGX_G007830 [Ephydatia muelleri]